MLNLSSSLLQHNAEMWQFPSDSGQEPIPPRVERPSRWPSCQL